MSKKFKKISAAQAVRKSKFGVNFRVYETGSATAGFVQEEAERGHLEQFYNQTSTFIYYILEGEGKFFLDGEEVPVQAGDLLVISPNTKIYYLGRLKLTLTTVPAWRAEDEVHVRDIPITK